MKVVVADLLQVSPIIEMLGKMAEEAGLVSVDWFQVSHTVIEDIRANLVLIAVGENNTITGSIGGAISSEWYSKEPILGDHWFFVREEHRKSTAAFKLIKEWKAVGAEIGVRMKVGHSLGGDRVHEKDNLFEKLGFTRVGSTFERQVDGRSM